MATTVSGVDSCIDTYLAMLTQLRQLSVLTVGSYRRDLLELTAFAGSLEPTTSLQQLTHFQVRRFASQLHARGQDARSIARKLSAWRGFFKWLGEQGIIAANPVDGIKAPRRSKPLPKALSADEAVHLVRAPAQPESDDPVRDACDYAMFALLYSSGLRVSELTQLDGRYQKIAGYESAGWIDLDGGEVTVTGKGNKKRTVPVGSVAIDALRSWLIVRNDLFIDECPALFLNTRGTRVSPRTIQLRLKAHALRRGIAANVHPHVLRHSFASHLLQSSGDLRAVQELMGHASIISTQIYTGLDFQRLAQVYDAAHPRAKKTP
jgi:integrase/recombinase XerC